MPKERRDEELRGKKQAATTFEPFKNGRLNLKTPAHYNWVLGYQQEPKHQDMKRAIPNAALPLSTINNQRCHSR